LYSGRTIIYANARGRHTLVDIDWGDSKCGREWKMQEQTAGVENVGVSPMDSQPENKLRWR